MSMSILALKFVSLIIFFCALAVAIFFYLIFFLRDGFDSVQKKQTNKRKTVKIFGDERVHKLGAMKVTISVCLLFSTFTVYQLMFRVVFARVKEIAGVNDFRLRWMNGNCFVLVFFLVFD